MYGMLVKWEAAACGVYKIKFTVMFSRQNLAPTQWIVNLNGAQFPQIADVLGINCNNC